MSHRVSVRFKTMKAIRVGKRLYAVKKIAAIKKNPPTVPNIALGEITLEELHRPRTLEEMGMTLKEAMAYRAKFGPRVAELWDDPPNP
jgi:hypothetical protein